MTIRHFHVGHNVAGYLPESDVYMSATVEDALAVLIDDLDRAVDHLAEVTDPDPGSDEYRDSDLPFAEAALEELRTIAGGSHRGDTYGTLEDIARDGAAYDLEDGSALPVTYWLNPCADSFCGARL